MGTVNAFIISGLNMHLLIWNGCSESALRGLIISECLLKSCEILLICLAFIHFSLIFLLEYFSAKVQAFITCKECGKQRVQPGKVDNHRITISYPGRGRACLHVRTLFSIRDNSETRYLLRKASAVVLKLKLHIMQVLYLKKN
mgnify:CR=1 FL=1